MVSSVTLAQIHCRLCEIFSDSDLPFAGKNILVFGDLLQVIINYLYRFMRNNIEKCDYPLFF